MSANARSDRQKEGSIRTGAQKSRSYPLLPHQWIYPNPSGKSREGRIGYALSVVESPVITAFEVELIGVQPEGGVAGVDIILARAFGPAIEDLGGVPPGTSGSPVYLGDRLIGAIAYAFPPDFTVVGITPIEAMLGLRDEPGSPCGEPPPAKEGKTHLAHEALGNGPLCAPGLAGLNPPVSGGSIDVVVGGFSSPTARAALGGLFGRGLPTGAGGKPEHDAAIPVEPGSAIGVGLLTGDLRAGFLGTTTLVEERELFAFGHPVLFGGPSRLALTQAVVYTTAAGEPPRKVADLGDVVGTVVQDRAEGVLARLDVTPDVIALELHVTDTDRTQTEVVRAQAANLPEILPSLVYSAAYETMVRAMNRVGPGRAAWEWTISFDDGERLARSYEAREASDVAQRVATSVVPILDDLLELGRVPRSVALNATVQRA